MSIAILTIYVVHKTPLKDNFSLVFQELDETTQKVVEKETYEYQALMMMALTFSGLVMLYRICQPFNLFRSVLFILSTLLCSLALLIRPIAGFLYTDWPLTNFTLSQILLMIIIVQASVPISGILIKAFDMLNPADDS